jgi:acetyltransferase-like isoleucine patch superfamily enzyme
VSDSIIHPGVELGRDVVIGPFCEIGVSPDRTDGEILKTIIGDGAVIRSHSVIYAGNIIGRGFKTGHHVTIRESNVIGDDVSVGTGSCIEHHVRISDRVRIHSQAFIPEFSILEDQVWIGPNVVLTNARYPRSPNVKEHLSGPHICQGAKIGANSTVLPGIKIGSDALVGAGSVVTKNVESKSVVAGNPATELNSVDNIPEYKETNK